MITMKKTTLIITAILFVMNLLFGLLLSAYKPFNVCFTSTVLIIIGIFMILLQSIRLKDAFAISLAFLFGFFGIVEFILGILSPNRFRDNGCLIVSVILFVIEVVLLIICNRFSLKQH